MKRSWTAWAVASVAILAVAGCNDYGNTFQNNTGASITGFSPSQVSAGGSPFTLTLTGFGFVAKTVAQWNGKPLTTHVTTDSTGAVVGNTITADVTADLIAKPGFASVITVNPASGAGNNGLSNPVTIVVNPPANPPPVLTSISPTSIVAQGMPFTLTLTGSSFLPTTDPSGGSVVRWNQGGTIFNSTTTPPPTTKIDCANPQFQYILITSSSQSQIVATVSPCLLQSSGTVSIIVFNPPAPAPTPCPTVCNGGGGGGSSAPQAFTISCPSGGCPKPAIATASATATVAAEDTPAVSVDGRFVAYTAVQNDHAQIFLRDTCEGATADCHTRTTLLSIASDGSVANDESHTPSISSDGRYVAFSSAATNLVDNAPQGRQIYLRDTCAGAGDSCKPSTHLVSIDPTGALVGTDNILPSVSSSGRFIAFLSVTPSNSRNQNSAQTQPSAGGNNSGYRQVFIRDTCLGATNCTPKTTRISLHPGDGTALNTKPAGPALSGNAKQVAIPSGNAATLFTRSIAIDDQVFLAIANEH